MEDLAAVLGICYVLNVQMKQNQAKMTAAQHSFIDHMGQQMVGWNLPRTTGRVWAYLLIRGEPAVLDDIAHDLEVAKSGASVGARQLVAFGLARTTGERGSRRVLVSAIDNMEAMFAARSESARSLQRLLLEGARAASTPGARTTLSDMASGINEILERESAALGARSRKGIRA
ncbi:MAG TPA: transcriptional regulator [Candidatus Limnocylindria bacterium]